MILNVLIIFFALLAFIIEKLSPCSKRLQRSVKTIKRKQTKESDVANFPDIYSKNIGRNLPVKILINAKTAVKTDNKIDNSVHNCILLI